MPSKPEDGMASLLRNLAEKTGKSVDEWVTIARSSGLGKHKEIVTYLKTEQALGHAHANQIALRALATEDTPKALSEDLVTAQYAGSKASLKPIHDAIVAAIQGFGPDVEFAPKKAYVSVRRSKQFALIQPSTATRLDLGVILKGVDPAGRLEASGSFNAMFTHRVKLAGVKDVDAEVVGWLREAYEGG